MASDLLAAKTDVPEPTAPQEGLHLYHFAGSGCSQMVRLAMAAKGVSFESHPIDIVKNIDQFEPEYARLNPRLVVPTMVRDGKVTTDSVNIMLYVDKNFDGPSLMPADAKLAEIAMKIIQEADSFKTPVIKFGKIPGLDPAKDPTANKPSNMAVKKEKLTKGLETCKDDPVVKAAYEARLDKMEKMGPVMASEETLLKTIDTAMAMLDQLEKKLQTGPFAEGGWLLTPDFTLADVTMVTMVNTFAWKGLTEMWIDPRPNVKAYLTKARALPAFQEAIVKWAPKPAN